MIRKEHTDKPNVFIEQGVPLVLTVVIFVLLSVLIFIEIRFLNLATATDIVTKVRWVDVLVGLTIYLKTSVDFAIFIGNLMATYPGMKNRIAIEVGTALGNALGTIVVLAIWDFFRDVEWLLAIMITLAALVLFKLAQEGLEHASEQKSRYPLWFANIILYFERTLLIINNTIAPILRYIVPNLSMKQNRSLSFWGLFVTSFTIPFILGLDDFAGYVPVFNIVNVFGFSVGVLAGHMILNIFLFVSPKKTITIVKNPIISFFGSVAFVALAIWGLFEVAKILFLH